MKKYLLSLLAVFSLFLMACPLQTDTVIEGDTATVPAWLPGTWVEIKNGVPGTTRYEVKADPKSKSKLTARFLGEPGENGALKPKPASLSSVKGKLYISVFDEGDEEESADGYYHFRLEKQSNGDVLLTPLKQSIVSSSTSGKELAAYIAGHSDAEYLDASAIETYRRQK